MSLDVTPRPRPEVRPPLPHQWGRRWTECVYSLSGVPLFLGSGGGVGLDAAVASATALLFLGGRDGIGLDAMVVSVAALLFLGGKGGVKLC
mmetsp:Transcript_40479/g.79214  ORF Transcript_40479/g.79214 Transcript_40479/m.79214 type:complete len:91 (-) Transcript_40479:43-315(-)